VYLATVIDCHCKKVIGWAMDDNDKTPLIEEAIRMAARNYRSTSRIHSVTNCGSWQSTYGSPLPNAGGPAA
jgi:hypothetical protein